MCGILFYKLGDVSPSIILKEFQKLKHRGPDSSGHAFVNKEYPFFIGTHRLAIINTDPRGDQPYLLSGVHLICNGQIYNYLALAQKYGIDPKVLRSDVDIILHLYVYHLDIDTLIRELDGDFAFVLIDGEHVFAGRDCIGVRPLYIGTDIHNKPIAFASEIKTIKDLPNVIGCHRFPPGYLYNKNKFVRYTDVYSKRKNKDTNIESIRQGIVASLKASVIKRIDNSDRPVAFLCSGGLDSSIILCIAAEYLRSQNRRLHVFSMEYIDTRSESDDAFYCKTLTDLLDVEYTAVTFARGDIVDVLRDVIYHTETYDPNTIRASIPMYLLARYLRKNTDYKVFLSGEGADELFAGYLYFKDADGSQVDSETKRLVKNLHMFDVLRADRCFSAHGLELRVPYLDKEFVKYVSGIDGIHKQYKNNIEKALLRDSFRKLYPELSRSKIIDRQKEKFSDGCGYSYVPQLLKYCHQQNTGLEIDTTLEEKEHGEKLFYEKFFLEFYPGKKDIIVKRELPAWCQAPNKSSKLLTSA